jgi:hypothetical protein
MRPRVIDHAREMPDFGAHRREEIGIAELRQVFDGADTHEDTITAARTRSIPRCGGQAVVVAHPSESVKRVFITENRVNGLSFPDCRESIIVFGLGYGLERLADIAWMRIVDVQYWGDIDTHGFGILNRLRAHLPHAHSFLMNPDTLHAHRNLWGQEPVDRR